MLLSACGPFKKDNKPKDLTPHEELFEKYSTILSMSKEQVRTENPVFGWAEMTGDGFLFNCLYQAAGGDTDMTFAIEPDGRPKRNPLYQTQPGKTSWSKDMEVGFLWCIKSHPDKTYALQILQQHINYGRDNNWDLCDDAPDLPLEDRLGRCKMSGALQNTLYQLLTYLGGDCDSECQFEK